MEIRKGTMQDIDELSALYDDVTDYLETHINYPGWRKGIYPTREDAKRGIQENTLFVAQKNQRIIGTIISMDTKRYFSFMNILIPDHAVILPKRFQR
ncbi:MAG: hypothetical protein SOY73_00420 [Blautia sp.]|nr:hypothetical protein [Blautia sp.]MDY3997577.1 hypothetical protein [Blautia sp.]